MSILVDILDLRSIDTNNYSISFGSVLAYCGLISICVFPIVKFSNAKKNISYCNFNAKPFKVISWLSLCYFIITLLVAGNSIYNVLTGDMGAIRATIYHDDNSQNYMAQLPPYFRIPLSFLNFVFGNPLILLFLSFFSIANMDRFNKYSIMLIFGSLSGVISGIAGADRSSVVYWIIGLGACSVIFFPCMEKKVKQKIKKYILLIVSLAFVYIFLMTISRFGQLSNSGGLSIIDYLGQPFINFAFYFDCYSPPFYSLDRIFPFISKYMFDSPFSNSIELNQTIADKTGLSVWIFSTFIGDIIISSGRVVAIIYCLIFTICSAFLLKLNNHRAIGTPLYYYLLFIIGSVMFFGLFVHYYANSTRTISVLVFFIFFKIWMKPVSR